MMLLPILSYVNFFGTDFLPVNLLTLKCVCAVIITVFLLSMLWIVNKKITRTRNMRLVNTNAFNELHKATFENNVITSYRIITKYPAAINIPHAIDGYTPFMRACFNGSTQLVRLMLSYGADVTHKSSRGETPFYLAVFYHIQHPHVKDASCIHTLYYAGADVNTANNKGYAPLHLAAMFGHTQLAQWLLNKGAVISVHPDPFVLARLQGHYETARLLEQRRLPAIQ